MRILLTNDDGIHAPGLRALKESLAVLGEVYVVAPDRERSASSHSVTVHKPLRIEALDTRSWAVTGTPADCVKIALEVCLKAPPDLVISGINRGPNLGTDVFYSGTVSGAFEGVIAGIPSLAVSIAVEGKDEIVNLDYATNFTRFLAQKIHRRGLPPDTLLNVNFPNAPKEEIKGAKITKLGWHRYVNAVHIREDPRGRVYYWLAGKVQNVNADAETDTAAVAKGLISITPMQLDLTNYRLLAELESWQLSKDVT